MSRLLLLTLLLLCPSVAGAENSRQRLLSRRPGPLGPAGRNPALTLQKILSQQRFAPLVKARPGVMKKLNDMAQAASKIQPRPIRIRPFKRLPRPTKPSLRLPSVRWPSWPGWPGWLSPPSLPSLPAMPPWLRRTLGSAGVFLLACLAFYLVLLVGLVILLLLARLLEWPIAAKLLRWLLVALPRRLRWLAERRQRQASRPGAVSSASDQPAAERAELEARTPQSWKALAAKLMADGKGREAFRALYLAMLSRLDRKGLIRYEASKTNWHYRMSLTGGPIRRAYGELSRIFDRTWYGDYPCDQAAFEEGDRLVDTVLSQTR